MGGTSARKKAAPSDFKRIKAKVGKRAPKPANVTNTRFKAASVAVRSQMVDRAANSKAPLELYSTRGRSLQDLTTQLHHPAAQVRASAIRGFADAVAHTDPEFLQAHLATLIPTVARSCVDEDDTVRPLALTVLRDVLLASPESMLKPFVPLLTAYVTSALHSLDRSTRFDGARAVQILSTTIPNLMAPQVARILPAFSALLADQNLHSSRFTHNANNATVNTDNQPHQQRNKRRKTTNSGSEGGRLAILQSLLSLLRTIVQEDTWSHGNTVADWDVSMADLTVLSNGKTANGLFVSGLANSDHFVKSVPDLQLVSDFVQHYETDDAKTSSSPLTEKHLIEELTLPIAHDLVSKLRDILVEITQRGTSELAGGLFLAVVDLEEFTLLIASIRRIWNAFICVLLQQSSCDDKQAIQLRQVFTNLLSLTLEIFPVRLQNPSNDHSVKYDLLNADICVTLMDIAGVLATDEVKRVEWIDKVSSYLVPRLEYGTSSESTEDKPGILSGELVDGNQKGSPGPSSTIVDVIGRLLILQDGHANFVLAQTTRSEILEKLNDAYFQVELLDVAIARSQAGRKAALLVKDLLACESFDVAQVDYTFPKYLDTMVKCLPLYLKYWGGDFPAEISIVVSTLHEVARRIDVDTELNTALIASLRSSLSALFTSPKRNHKSKGQKPYNGNGESTTSLFETYPEVVQRKALGLVGMLQSPSDETVNGLSSICARSRHSESPYVVSSLVADSIVQIMHTIRRNLPMPTYLGFIINGIGLATSPKKRKRQTPTDKPGASISVSGTQDMETGDDVHPASLSSKRQLPEDIKELHTYDDAILRATRSFILCGSEKVLPMLCHVLTYWLECDENEASREGVDWTIRFRAASATIAMLILDIQSRSSTKTSVFDVSRDLAVKLKAAACDALLSCPAKNAEDVQVEAFKRFMQPVMALMANDIQLVNAILDEAATRLCSQSLDESESTKIMEALLTIVHNTQLQDALRASSDELIKFCDSIEKVFTDGPMGRLASNLRSSTQLLIGHMKDA